MIMIYNQYQTSVLLNKRGKYKSKDATDALKNRQRLTTGEM